MLKNYFILILLLFGAGLPVKGQQDTLKLVPGISTGFMGADIINPSFRGDFNASTQVNFAQSMANANFNLRFSYGKNNMQLGFAIGKRILYGYWVHTTIDRGLTALLLNYQRKLFGSEAIAVYGSYVFLNRFLNNYAVNAGDGNGEFLYNYFSIEQFLGYALKVRLYRQLYFEQKTAYGYGFGNHQWDYTKEPFKGKKKFEGQAYFISFGVVYDFQRKKQYYEKSFNKLIYNNNSAL